MRLSWRRDPQWRSRGERARLGIVKFGRLRLVVQELAIGRVAVQRGNKKKKGRHRWLGS